LRAVVGPNCAVLGKTIAQHLRMKKYRSRPRQTIDGCFMRYLLLYFALPGTVTAHRLDEFAHRRQLLDVTQTFTTPGTVSFLVPAGVTSVTATLLGASGGTTTTNGNTAYGGFGGKSSC